MLDVKLRFVQSLRLELFLCADWLMKSCTANTKNLYITTLVSSTSYPTAIIMAETLLQKTLRTIFICTHVLLFLQLGLERASAELHATYKNLKHSYENSCLFMARTHPFKRPYDHLIIQFSLQRKPEH